MSGRRLKWGFCSVRPATDPPPPSATDCNALLFLSCRLSYRTGQDTANCDTCRNSACIIYRYVNILFPLYYSEWQMLFTHNCNNHWGPCWEDSIRQEKKVSFLDHNSRLCLNSHLSAQPPTPNPRYRTPGWRRAETRLSCKCTFVEQVSFWWLPWNL